MIKILGEYINYKLNAKGRHGVHSPFVYDLVDIGLRKKLPKNVLKRFKHYKNELRGDLTRIKVKDLGAGSKRLSSQRKIKDIAKVSGSRVKYGKLLYKLVYHYKPETVLELGTSVGIGTFMLSQGNSNGNVVTIEGCPMTSDVAKRKLEKFETNNAEFIVKDFTSYLNSYSGSKIDFVFIDGDHRGEKLLEMLNQLTDHIHDETIILLDDIRWNNDMLFAWNKIVSDHRFHLTVDLFKMGIVMLRNHQEKEHFVINY
jgi:predicted O-methyltransferase YrrM